MEVLVVRHADAGSKGTWDGDDRLRPLSPQGRADAAALVRVLEPYGPRRIVSSALVRCVQSVEPLAASLGLEVERSALLTPDAGARAARFVQDLGTGTAPVVVCTHGETIAAMREAFARTGPGGRGRAGADVGSHAKGSVWVLEFEEGRLDGERYVPPDRLVGAG